jgi:hypothetical protein
MHLKQMLHLERKKLTLKKIKYQTKENFQPPNLLQIQQPNGKIKEINIIEEIATQVCKYNMTHYS